MRMEAYTDVPLDGEQIPKFLQAQQRWLTWTLTTGANGKPTKKPDRSTREPKTALTFDAIKGVVRWSEGGIGFITTGKIPVPLNDGRNAWLLVFDLDGCRDPSTGQLVSWATWIYEELGKPYTEVSPSGTGLRLLIAVIDLPPHLKATKKIDWPAPPGVKKQPGVQLFGTGPAGYVTITGARLADAAVDIPVVQNADAVLQHLELIGEAPAPPTANGLVGLGSAPGCSEIANRIDAMPNGRELIAADWQKVMPEKSASEAFFKLVTYTLTAADGHGDAALDFLLHATMWGAGQVDDSRDPSKYTRASWVSKEIQRAAAKRGTPSTAVEVFDVLPVPEVPEVPEPPKGKSGSGDPALVTEFLRNDGPLIRLPTGLSTLDALTGGGLPLGSRVYLIGAPDAGKTALAVQVADVYLRAGIPVGILGIDEEPVDVITRLMQRRGIARDEMEQRAAETLQQVEHYLAEMPLRLFDSETSIENAAVKTHEFAKQVYTPASNSTLPLGRKEVYRPPCVLIVDSVQTARCEKEDDSGESLYKAVTQRVRAIRAAASRYRMLVIVTSEMNRGAYRSRKVDEQTTDMASGKESGAIEFSARILLSLRNVPGSADHLELRVVKNKHGLSHRSDQTGIFLAVDRAGQQLQEDGEFKPVDVEERREEITVARTAIDAARLIVLLMEVDLGRNAARNALSNTVPSARFDSARSWLIETGTIAEIPGPNRSKIMQLQPTRVSPEMKILVARLLGSGMP